MFDVETFHRRAVETPSHESVAEMRDLLVDTVAEHGPEPTVDDAGNVLAMKGSGSPHYVLNTHIDTVPPHVPYRRTAEPPGPAAEEGVGDAETDQDGDVVRGRGSCDAKGPLAALLSAFFATDPDGRLTLAVTPDEETTSAGAHHLDLGALGDLPPVDGYIVGEPTDLDACNAAKGRFEGTITISGEAAHAAEPESGLSAIRAAAPVIQAMETYDTREAQRASDGSSGDQPRDGRGPGEHDSLGRPTLQATMIEGGEAINQIPAACEISFDRRSVPPETADGFRAGLEEHLYQWLPRGMGLSVTLTQRETPFLEAFATDADDPVVAALADASGGAVRPFGAATEASYFAADAPTVVFGPGVLADEDGAVAHSEREYVRLSDVRAAAEALESALSTLL